MIKYNKQDITSAVYDRLPEVAKYYGKEPIDTLLFKWWTTSRSGSGLQLSYEGMTAFQFADMQFYQFDLDHEELAESPNSVLIKINKRMPCPFYLNIKSQKPYIRIYDNKVAMLITLYGTFTGYLNSLKK